MFVNFRAILNKELRSYFLSPFIYLISAVFLLLSGYYFYTDLIFYVQFGFGLNIMENSAWLLKKQIASIFQQRWCRS